MSDTWTDRLSEYIDATLSESERGALEAHLSGCADCRATLEELRRVVARARPFTPALVMGEVRWLEGRTPYERWGDGPFQAGALASGALALLRRRRR
jgi:anti-sigma factor RsiW